MKRSVKERIEKHRAEGRCIACGKPQIHKRECCIACHGRYISNQPKTQKHRQIYEAEAIAAGFIGENRQGQRLKLNPLKELAAKVEGARC